VSLKKSSNLKGNILAGFMLVVLAPASIANTIEEVIDLPATLTNMYGRVFTHPIKLTIFRDDERTRSPFLVLNHGRPATSGDFLKMGRVRFADQAKYFVTKGFVVFVPTRVGYGVTGGEDMENSGTCSAKDYPPVYEAAAQQSIKVIEHARALPYVDGARGMVVGQSFGGATAIALAAKNLPGVVAAVNFAGGGGGDPVGRPRNPCRDDLLEKLFASYGATSRIPTLWLYSENDKYFGKEKPQTWFAAFLKKGGVGEFTQLPPLPPSLGEDGHTSFTRNPDAWRPLVDEFLRRNAF
jgi:dienelactone hydrolase